ncbi:MAG: hypothetical protein JAZ20_14600 [Candidatus Thiodiazotropha weberae]|nr:hypothetical protein [Candidatus Thiodiazotropha lotti]MCG8010167.1 hypothetical protein [Candidatus Thiodiazotropha lotti]MCG8021636.1 hypothetical protein [Candidatus Thiodiazotropha lotti]MCW4208805.1 hypothetical protein [Candidatus Thiodiazotropha lotti]MCW4209625.1 hypothetical protein [Candidatus Thiodiazotropha lotti]
MTIYNPATKISLDTDQDRFVANLVKYNRKIANVLSEEGRHWRGGTPGLLSEAKYSPPSVTRRKTDSDKSGRDNSNLE